MPGTRKLGRTTAQRTAMLRAMVTFLLENGKIETTLTRAKEVQAMAEKMITRAKEDSVHNRRVVAEDIKDEAILAKLFTDIAPRFATRNGGYTRILKLGRRNNDAAEIVILELVDRKVKEKKDKKDKKEKKAEAAAPAEKA